jgi:hypothetical protein
MLLFCTLSGNVLDPMVSLLVQSTHAGAAPVHGNSHHKRLQVETKTLFVEGGNVSGDLVYLFLVKRPIGRLFF